MKTGLNTVAVHRIQIIHISQACLRFVRVLKRYLCVLLWPRIVNILLKKLTTTMSTTSARGFIFYLYIRAVHFDVR